MKKKNRLTLIAALMGGVMCSPHLLVGNIHAAVTTQAGNSTNARAFKVQKDINIYQIALQSGISVKAFHELNNQRFAKQSALKVGDTVLLPADSPLFPKEPTPVAASSTLPGLASGAAVQQGLDMETEIARAAQFAANKPWDGMNSEKLKDMAVNQAESWAKGQVQSNIISPLEQKAEEYLGQFGKAEVNLSVDDEGSLKGSSLSLLAPLYDDGKENLVFGQTGIRDYDGNTIGHLGLGYRYDEGNYMIGANAFVDHDFSRNHTRGSIGAELWADNLKLSTNYYTPLSGWRASEEVRGFDARAAKGFDINFQGYLPSYPHLGVSAKYEQYFGDQVALFGKDNRQRDPSAFTIGVDYTPVPLATFKTSYKTGQGGNDEFRFDANLNIQLGTPIEQQLDPANVAVMRSLRGSRYDLVDRNYNIVLEYREQDEVFDVAISANKLVVEPAELLPIDLVANNNKHDVTQVVSWNQLSGAYPIEMQNSLGAGSLNGWSFKAPPWSPTPGDNTYRFTVTVRDAAGHEKTSNPIEVLVSQVMANSNVVVNPLKIKALPNNQDSNIIQISFSPDASGNVLPADVVDTFIEKFALIGQVPFDGVDLIADGTVTFTHSYDAETGLLTIHFLSEEVLDANFSIDFGIYGDFGDAVQISFMPGSAELLESTFNADSHFTFTYVLKDAEGKTVLDQNKGLNPDTGKPNWSIYDENDNLLTADAEEYFEFEYTYNTDGTRSVIAKLKPGRVLPSNAIRFEGNFNEYGTLSIAQVEYVAPSTSGLTSQLYRVGVAPLSLGRNASTEGLIPVEPDDDLIPDTYYTVRVTNAEGEDVTAHYAHTIKWFYDDPDTAPDEHLFIERCGTGKAQFSTQRQNQYDFDGKLIPGAVGYTDAQSVNHKSEQGLRLFATIDTSDYRFAPAPDAIYTACADGIYVTE